MKSKRNLMEVRILMLVSILALMPVLPVCSDGLSGIKDGFNRFSGNVDRKIPGTLEIGTRITHFDLTNDKDDFIGSVDKLEAVQRYEPTNVFIDWWCPADFKGFNLGIELTWDMVQARAVTTRDGHRDGTLNVSGPILALLVRWNNDSRFTPYAGVGAAFMNRTHVSKGWWHYGFPNRGDTALNNQPFVEWRQAGSPSWPNNGYTRSFKLDDTTGLVLIGGMNWKWTERLLLDFYVRHMDMEVDHDFDLRFYGELFHRERDTFDLTNVAYGLGVKFRFA